MSELSDSYHLSSDNQSQGIATLQRAGLRGWVFPPGSGWTTVVPRGSEYGEPNRTLLAANESQLLYFLNAEDHGWMFSLFQRKERVCHYECSWLDAWEGGVRIDDSALDLELVSRIAASHGTSASAIDAEAALNELLHPPSKEWLWQYRMSHGTRGVASAFADMMALPYHRFLSSEYLEKDELTGDLPEYVVRV